MNHLSLTIALSALGAAVSSPEAAGEVADILESAATQIRNGDWELQQGNGYDVHGREGTRVGVLSVDSVPMGLLKAAEVYQKAVSGYLEGTSSHGGRLPRSNDPKTLALREASTLLHAYLAPSVAGAADALDASSGSRRQRVMIVCEQDAIMEVLTEGPEVLDVAVLNYDKNADPGESVEVPQDKGGAASAYLGSLRSSHNPKSVREIFELGRQVDPKTFTLEGCGKTMATVVGIEDGLSPDGNGPNYPDPLIYEIEITGDELTRGKTFDQVKAALEAERERDLGFPQPMRPLFAFLGTTDSMIDWRE